jgi:nicotinamidase-related amidase
MHTLLIIDMQNAWIDENPRYDVDGVIRRINLVSDSYRTQGKHVIFVRHNNGDAEIGSSAWQIHEQLEIKPKDLFVDKIACDPFSQTDLMDQLKKLDTSQVTICGLATEFCVDSAVRATLSYGFDVLVLSDAHTTANRDHLSAKAIIDHHNWIWANLAAPAGRSIEVKPTDTIL